MSFHYRISCIVFLCILSSCQPATPEKNLSPEATRVEQLAIKQMRSFDVPGLAVGVIKNGEVLYAGAHGFQGLDSPKPLTTHSLFHMASVSKPFVATAMAQLLEQGKIQLDDKLTDHLPYFTMADGMYKEITLNHMLNHSSGIPDVEDYEWDNPQYDDGAVERFARSHANIKLDFAPGTEFSYSNAAFDILCDVIARASGLTFEAYVKQHIFEPVGMTNSTFLKPEVPAELATKPHILGDDLRRVVSKVYPYNRRHAGSSTLHSNVEDMLLWAQVNLNKGIINGNRIYQESSFRLLTTSQIKINTNRSVGLSWFQKSLKGSNMVYHSGGDLGYSTFFGFLPEQKSAIVIMTNTDGFWAQDAASTILANTIFGDSLNWKAPIHYKLKDHILTEGIEKTRQVYFDERDQSPQNYLFSGDYIDNLGYWLIDRGQAQKALEVFMLNVELEPEDSGWPDSVADAYVAMDSTEAAIKWYKKALEMKPTQNFTIRKLNRLLQD
ncbi:MAG: serine hydrolase [Roseivirga sp.]|nr:serine hydrolase [Roseivirga sp.]